MKVLEWFRSVAASLGDDEPNRPFQRYLLKDLVHAYNRGLSLVYSYRPDKFTTFKKVRLVPGASQRVKGCCDNVLYIAAQVDEKGGVIKTLRNSRDHKTVIKKSWSKPSCIKRTTADGKEIPFVLDYAIVEVNMNGYFTVHPPIPCDTPVWVKVACVSPPCNMTEADMNKTFDDVNFHNAAIYHYVLGSMLLGDRQASNSAAEAFNHINLFYTLMGVELTQEVMVEADVISGAPASAAVRSPRRRLR